MLLYFHVLFCFFVALKLCRYKSIISCSSDKVLLVIVQLVENVSLSVISQLTLV